MGSVTPNFGMYLPAAGETGWATSINANFSTIDSNLTNSLPRAYLAGCQLSNNAGTPTTKIDISAGQAQDAGNAGALTLAATLTKDLSAVWAVGSGNGGLGNTVTRATNTWYHMFLIKRTDTNVVDAYFDTSVSAANIPSPYTLFRRLGSVRTDGTGSGNILAFTQDGDYFQWSAAVTDVNDAPPASTNAITKTLTVPIGVNVVAALYCDLTNAGPQTCYALYSDLSTTDTAPAAGRAQLLAKSNGTTSGGTSLVLCRTNTSAQIRTRVSNVTGFTHTVGTYGWYDSRGRFA